LFGVTFRAVTGRFWASFWKLKGNRDRRGSIPPQKMREIRPLRRREVSVSLPEQNQHASAVLVCFFDQPRQRAHLSIRKLPVCGSPLHRHFSSSPPATGVAIA